jgi:hypothetical protein
MSKPSIRWFYLLTILLISSLIGCAGGTRGKLKRVQQPTEGGLKQDWQNYTVYYRNRLAFLYKIKNEGEIVLDNRWVKISSEEMMAKSKVFFSTWVKEILGQNDEMFGYLVHKSTDTASVKIIDQNTVQLYYHYRQTESGP